LVKLVTDLKKTIAQQSAIIENNQAELVEIKEEQQAFQAQNNELQDEIRTLRGQVSALSASLPSTRSWASVVAGTRGTQASTSVSTAVSNERPKKEANCLRISTQASEQGAEPSEEGFARYLSTEKANNHIRDALHKVDTTKDVQVAGVGTTKTGYTIRFKDGESMATAKANTAWLQVLGNGTKLVKPRFGVVVHRMPTEGLQLPEHKKEAIEKITEENDLTAKGYCVDDIAWLKMDTKLHGRPNSQHPIR
jgi:hypothetical protein